MDWPSYSDWGRRYDCVWARDRISISDNDSLIRDKSIDLNNIEVQLEGGSSDRTRNKSITLQISVAKNDNDKRMEFESELQQRRKSKTPKKDN